MIVNTGDTTEVSWEHRDPETGAELDPTSVLATLRQPDGTTILLEVTRVAAGSYRVQVPTPISGDYVLAWSSTGPDEVDERAIAATPPGQSAPWAPTLRDVAAFIPGRTRRATPDGDNEPSGTFGDQTYPTGDAVTALIFRAVAWVQGHTGTPVDPRCYGQALGAAALWAAAWVELGYPTDGTTAYSQLRADAVAATEQAAAFNLGLGGGGDAQPDDPETPDALSSYKFDEPAYFPAAGSYPRGRTPWHIL